MIVLKLIRKWHLGQNTNKGARVILSFYSFVCLGKFGVRVCVQ